MEAMMKECRYCLSEEDFTDMITPCLCEGSMKYVHTNCLKDWITKKGSTDIVEDEIYYQLKCELCKYKMRYLKEYENGLFISLIRTIIIIFLDLKNISIFIVQFILIYYLIIRMINVLDYGSSIMKGDFEQKNPLNVFHEFVIFMSIFFGINDIFKYYRSIFRETRNVSFRFSSSKIIR